MKYPQLEGICKIAIDKGICTGCNKLELIEFRGVKQCKYIQNPREKIKEILGIQIKLNL